MREPQDYGSNPGGAVILLPKWCGGICALLVSTFYLTLTFFRTPIFFPITYAYCGRIGLTPNSNFFQSLFLFNHICMYHGRIGSGIGLSRMFKFGLRLLVCFSCALTRLPRKH